MSRIRAFLALFIFGGMLSWACSEPMPSEPEGLLQVDPAFSHLGGGVCDVDFRDLARSARGFFGQPEQREASDLIRDLDDACETSGDPEDLPWLVLELMERVLDDGRAGSLEDGSVLAYGMLHLVDALPSPGAPSDFIDASDPNPFSIETTLGAALGSGGIFAVVDADHGPAGARDPVPFQLLTEDPPRELDALYAVATQEGLDWPTSIGIGNEDRALVLAHPVRTGDNDPLLEDFLFSPTTVGDQLVTELQYVFNMLPDPGTFSEQLRVAACFSEDVFDSLSASERARLSKDGVLLEDLGDDVGTLCDAVRETALLSDASVFGSLFANVTSLLSPEPLHAFGFTSCCVSGGAFAFSQMGSVFASADGYLMFTDSPSDVIAIEPDADCTTVDGTCALLGTVAVKALTGAGTPIEAIEITLSIGANQGVPAGAVLNGDLSESTSEGEGVATFGPDANLQVDKAGGYRLCANALDTSFNLAEACVDFHVRND